MFLKHTTVCYKNQYFYVKEIKVAETNSYFTAVNGVLFSKEKDVLVAFPRQYAEKSYKVLDGVTTIGSYAFCYAFKLENISLPSTLTEIQRSGFYNCNGLKEVKIPEVRMVEEEEIAKAVVIQSLSCIC